MAKSQSILQLQGTLAGLTFVKSHTYGDHVRAKRGTYNNGNCQINYVAFKRKFFEFFNKSHGVKFKSE